MPVDTEEARDGSYSNNRYKSHLAIVFMIAGFAAIGSWRVRHAMMKAEADRIRAAPAVEIRPPQHAPRLPTPLTIEAAIEMVTDSKWSPSVRAETLTVVENSLDRTDRYELVTQPRRYHGLREWAANLNADAPRAVRTHAHPILAFFGGEAELARLWKDATDHDRDIRGSARNALLRTTAVTNWCMFFDAMWSEDAELRDLSVRRMGGCFPSPAWLARLIAAAKSEPNEGMQNVLTSALAACSFEESIGALKAIARTTRSVDVKNNAISGVETLSASLPVAGGSGRHPADAFIAMLSSVDGERYRILLEDLLDERLPALGYLDWADWWKTQRPRACPRKFICRVSRTLELDPNLINEQPVQLCMLSAWYLTDEELRATLRTLVIQTTNRWCRLLAGHRLATMGDFTGLPGIVEEMRTALKDRDEKSVLFTVRSLKEMTGQNFLADPDAWTAWWQANGMAFTKEWGIEAD